MSLSDATLVAPDDVIAGVERFVGAADAALRGAGLDPGANAHQRRADILALVLSIERSTDRDAARSSFAGLAIPILANTRQQQLALQQRFSEADAAYLVEAIFAPAAQDDPIDPMLGGASAWGGGRMAPSHDAPAQSPSVETDRKAPAELAEVLQWIERALTWLSELWAKLNPATARAHLVRKRLSDLADKVGLRLPAVTTGLQPRVTRRAAVLAAERRVTPTRRLDVGRTIAATIKRGALFTPRWRQRSLASEYLFLARQVSGNDLAHARVKSFAEDLRAQGVTISFYSYRLDPREVIDALGPTRSRLASLDTLRERHPNARLVIASEGRELLHPITLEPYAWVSELDSWARRALVSPIRSGDWGFAEAAIHFEAGFSLSSSAEHRLDNLGYLLGGVGPIAVRAKANQEALTPVFVAATAFDHMDAAAPDAAEQAAILADLEQYLGPVGLRWLAICAHFPAMAPAIAYQFGRKLQSEEHLRDDELEDLFARISGLPWMRFGFMPHWARKLVSDGLTNQERAAARRIAQSIFAGKTVLAASGTGVLAGPGDTSAMVLPIRVGAEGQAGGLEVDDLAIEMMTAAGDDGLDPLLDLSLAEELERLHAGEANAQAAAPSPPLTESGAAEALPESPIAVFARSAQNGLLIVHRAPERGAAARLRELLLDEGVVDVLIISEQDDYAIGDVEAALKKCWSVLVLVGLGWADRLSRRDPIDVLLMLAEEANMRIVPVLTNGAWPSALRSLDVLLASRNPISFDARADTLGDDWRGLLDLAPKVTSLGDGLLKPKVPRVLMAYQKRDTDAARALVDEITIALGDIEVDWYPLDALREASSNGALDRLIDFVDLTVVLVSSAWDELSGQDVLGLDALVTLVRVRRRPGMAVYFETDFPSRLPMIITLEPFKAWPLLGFTPAGRNERFREEIQDRFNTDSLRLRERELLKSDPEAPPIAIFHTEGGRDIALRLRDALRSALDERAAVTFLSANADAPHLVRPDAIGSLLLIIAPDWDKEWRDRSMRADLQKFLNVRTGVVIPVLANGASFPQDETSRTLRELMSLRTFRLNDGVTFEAEASAIISELAEADEAVVAPRTARSRFEKRQDIEILLSYAPGDDTFADRLTRELTRQGYGRVRRLGRNANAMVEQQRRLAQAEVEIVEVTLFVMGATEGVFGLANYTEAARTLGKRIIPLLRPGQLKPPLDFDPASVFRLSSLSDVTNDVVTELCEHIDVDSEWVKRGSQLLRLARRWEQMQHDPTLLLHPDESAEADTWMRERPSGAPEIAKLVRAFLSASHGKASFERRESSEPALAGNPPALVAANPEYVLILHSAVDRVKLKPIVEALLARNIRVWIDSADGLDLDETDKQKIEVLHSSRGWRKAFDEAFDGAMCVLACWSANTLSGSTTERLMAEARLAKKRGRLVQCAIGVVESGYLPYELAQEPLYHVRGTNAESLDALVAAVVKTLNAAEVKAEPALLTRSEALNGLYAPQLGLLHTMLLQSQLKPAFHPWVLLTRPEEAPDELLSLARVKCGEVLGRAWLQIHVDWPANVGGGDDFRSIYMSSLASALGISGTPSAEILARNIAARERPISFVHRIGIDGSEGRVDRLRFARQWAEIWGDICADESGPRAIPVLVFEETNEIAIGRIVDDLQRQFVGANAEILPPLVPVHRSAWETWVSELKLPSEHRRMVLNEINATWTRTDRRDNRLSREVLIDVARRLGLF